MSEITKVTSSHVSRLAIVYVRQSSATQVENNRESTARQYALKQRAEALGWSADRIVVIDDVFTDGLTLNEVARALRLQGGAERVFGVTLVRQPWIGRNQT